MSNINCVNVSGAEFMLLVESLGRDRALKNRVLEVARVNLKLTEEERENIREVIGSELARTGVDERGAINDRGMLLDGLIDRFAVD